MPLSAHCHLHLIIDATCPLPPTYNHQALGFDAGDLYEDDDTHPSWADAAKWELCVSLLSAGLPL